MWLNLNLTLTIHDFEKSKGKVTKLTVKLMDRRNEAVDFGGETVIRPECGGGDGRRGKGKVLCSVFFPLVCRKIF
jgi:hypothetical protein